jgi:hypothetical protein
VPSESKAARTARQIGQWSRLVGLLVVLGLILIGICLFKLLILKAAGPLVPLALAFVLACFSGWVVGPLFVPRLTPTLDRWWSQAAVESGSAPGDQASGADPQGGKSALSRLQSAVTQSLATKPDPRLVSWFIVSAASLPVWILFVCWIRSVSRRGACAALVPIALWLSATEATAAPDGISYTREFLRAEQQVARDFLLEVDRRCVTARRLLDVGLLDDLAEEIVRANFFSRRSGIPPERSLGQDRPSEGVAVCLYQGR